MKMRVIFLVGALIIIVIFGVLLYRQSAAYCEPRISSGLVKKVKLDARDTDCGGIGYRCSRITLKGLFGEACSLYVK